MTDLGTLDSYGMKWMGTVPENWSISPAKRHFYIQLGKMLQNGPEAENDCTVPYLKAVNVLWGRANTEDTPEMWASPDEIMLYGVRDGDLLVCEGGEVGRAGIVRNPPDRCIIQNALHRVRARNSSSVSFLMYVLHSVNSSGWFDVLCNKATIAHFTGQKFAELRVPLPSPKRQRAISTFLDRETSRIDDLIAKKQCQIELLQEKRFALISHVITKGLDPDVKMKDTGDEWLGEIPESWAVYPIKRVSTRIQTGCTPPTTEERYYELGTIPWYGPGSFGMNLVLSEPTKLLNEGSIREGAARIFAEDSVMVVAIGATIGKVGYLASPASSNQQIAAITPNQNKVSGKFLAYQLKRLEPVLRGIAPSTTLPIIDQQELGSLPCALPSLDEQKRIVQYIDLQSQKIDRMVETIRKSIDLLREYRTALISAAVTGKIDVREEVA